MLVIEGMDRGWLLALMLSGAACADSPPRPIVLPPATTAAPVAEAPAAPVVVTQVGLPDEQDAAVPVSPRNPTWGSRLAPVTIVEFSEFQCPFCKRVQPTIDQIKSMYGADKLRIVWKNDPLPFHMNAKPAAEAGAGVYALAGAEAFWKFHDLAFENQTALGKDSYLAWAAQAGVRDLPSYAAGLEAHQWSGDVDKDLGEGKTLGASGTPTFFINGVRIAGAQPFENFKQTIDDELRKAADKRAAGTPEARIYAIMAKENWKAPDPEDADRKEDSTTVFKIPVGKGPVLGGAKALVTIIEFGDFQCPFCARVDPTLRAILGKYGDKVRLVWKHEPLPFHLAAEPAAEAAIEVRAEKGDAAFWKLHDRLFADQGSLMKSDKIVDVDKIVQAAVDSGGSADRVRKAIESHAHKKLIDADYDLSEDFQASGTPHFFIDGRRLVGAQPEEKFDKIIDEELAKAQDLVAKGTRPADVYDALTKDGKTPPEPEKKDLPRGLAANDPATGSPRAKVVVHEWADFQCPFCARVEPTLTQLMKEYGDRIRLVWHDLPLAMHPDAQLAAQAAREALAQKGTGAFWSIHDKMMHDQKKLQRQDLDGYAQELKLDPGLWAAALDGGTHTGEIEASKKAANDGAINGTPAFIVVAGNAARGYFINGAQSYGKFRRIVERALAEAR